MTRLLAICVLLTGCATPRPIPDPAIAGCYAITIAPQRFMLQDDRHSLYFSAPKVIELTASTHPHFTPESGFKLVKTSSEPSIQTADSLWRVQGNNVALRIGDDFSGITALLSFTDKGLSGPAEPYTDTGPYTIYGGHLYAIRVDCQHHGPNNSFKPKPLRGSA